VVAPAAGEDTAAAGNASPAQPQQQPEVSEEEEARLQQKADEQRAAAAAAAAEAARAAEEAARLQAEQEEEARKAERRRWGRLPLLATASRFRRCCWGCWGWLAGWLATALMRSKHSVCVSTVSVRFVEHCVRPGSTGVTPQQYNS
jgi:hypothetical protein